MTWNIPVSINEIDIIKEALQCNIRMFDLNNLPILNATDNIYNSLMYESEYRPDYKECDLLFDNDHYHCITNIK
jgi:hypothetical protein